jgi:hypothetical protein
MEGRKEGRKSFSLSPSFSQQQQPLHASSSVLLSNLGPCNRPAGQQLAHTLGAGRLLQSTHTTTLHCSCTDIHAYAYIMMSERERERQGSRQWPDPHELERIFEGPGLSTLPCSWGVCAVRALRMCLCVRVRDSETGDRAKERQPFFLLSSNTFSASPACLLSSRAS